MQDDDQHPSDRMLTILSVIIGVAIVGYVVYALIIYQHLSSIISRFIR
jgi:hypothetical protein